MDLNGFHELIPNIVYSIRTEYDNKYVNIYLLKGEYAILIDSGIVNTYEILLKALEFLKLDQFGLRLLINTHGHWDHIGLNSKLKNQHKSIIISHKDDVPLIEDHNLQWEVLFNRFPTIFPQSDEFKRQFISRIGKPCTVDLCFSHYLSIQLGNITLELFHTPGHSEGSICIYVPQKKILFSGDSILGNGFFGALPMYCNVTAYINSLKRVENMEVGTVFSSHLPPLEGRKEVNNFLRQSFLSVTNIEQTIINVLEGKSLSIGEISRMVCEQLKKNYTVHSILTVLSHLENLEHHGVTKRMENGQKWSI